MTDSTKLLLDKLNKHYDYDFNNVIFKLAEILNKPQEDLYDMVEKSQAVGAGSDDFDWITVHGSAIPIQRGLVGEARSQAIKQGLAEKFHAKKDETVDFVTAKSNYEKDVQTIKKESYSYDPDTGESFNFESENETVNFYKNYGGDGKNPIFVTATTNNTTPHVNDDLDKAFNSAHADGIKPFFGKWTDPQGKVFTDVSIVIKDEKIAREIKVNYKQQVILKIHADGRMESIMND